MPIDIAGCDSFETLISNPTTGAPLDPNAEYDRRRRHRMHKAVDIKDDDVVPEDLEALRWLRGKRADVDLGETFRLQSADGSRRDLIPGGFFRAEIPYFQYGKHETTLAGQAGTLRGAVQKMRDVLAGHEAEPKDTYPGRDEMLGKTLAEIRNTSIPDGVDINVSMRVDIKVRHLLALIREYYEIHCTGGTLHCILDDGNMRDSDVEHGIRDARNKQDGEALLIAVLLRMMTEGDRNTLYERGYGR